MDWSTYVKHVVGDDRQTEVARRTGIDQTTISRWLRPGSDAARISSQNVAKFARGYDRPVLEAFVVAGFLTADEADLKGQPLELAQVNSAELIAELQRRISG